MRFVRRAPTAALCALAAHALVYRTLAPADGMHGYFGWYEPVVAVASLACLAALLALLVVAALARRLGRPLRRAVAEPAPLGGSVRSLAVASLAAYLVQEAVERSVVLRRPSAAVLAPSQSLTLLAAIACVSFLLCLALRAGRALALRALAPDRAVVGVATLSWSLRAAAPARPRPLAARSATRAPPLLPT